MCYISQGMLDRNSQVVSTKKEDLISDNNYSNNSISNSTQCIIDKCRDRGAKLIATTDDSENYSQYLEPIPKLSSYRQQYSKLNKPVQDSSLISFRILLVIF